MPEVPNHQHITLLNVQQYVNHAIEKSIKDKWQIYCIQDN